MGTRVLIDLLGFTGSRGGTETYAREISRRLPEAMPEATFAAVTGRTGGARVRAFFPGNVHIVPWVGDDRVTWAAGETLAVNAIARRVGADLIWTPANFGPITRGPKRVSTIHDVTYHLSDVPPLTRAVHRATGWLMGRTAVTADAVISGSHSAADEIVARLGLDINKITVVPHGTNAPRPPAEPWRRVAQLGIVPGRPILLSSGNRLPHKNFEGLIAAVAAIEPAERPLVVITGGGDPDPLEPLVNRLDLESDVILPGWVDSEQLEALYSVASLYVCPSLAEGFGLPVIDAMRRGCAVLANDIPVLREVGGSAASYADANSSQKFAVAIEASIATAMDAHQRDLRREWSEQFTWERSAAETAAVFGSVLAHDG